MLRKFVTRRGSKKVLQMNPARLSVETDIQVATDETQMKHRFTTERLYPCSICVSSVANFSSPI